MNIVLCDDSKTDRQTYGTILHGLATKYNVEVNIMEYMSGEQILFDFEDQKISSFVDLIFLDISMLKTDGIQAAKKLRELNCDCEIVFLTNSKTHMLEAFDVNAFNYLIKGRDNTDRFESVFRQAIDIADEKAREFIRFTGVGETRNVAINSIKYFEVMRKIVIVHYNKDEFEFVSTLEKIESVLADKGIVRIHRSFLVSLKYIQSYTYEQLKLYDGTLLPIGRKYYKELKDALSQIKKI